MARDEFYGFDPIRLADLYMKSKTDRQRVITEARIAAEAKLAQMQNEFAHYVVASRGNGASWSAMARALGKSETVLRKAAAKVLDSESLQNEYLSGALNTARANTNVYKIRTMHRGNLHITIPVEADPTGYGMRNVLVDPSAMRVLNVAPNENGTQMLLTGEAVDAWQAELDTPGSTLRNTVDKHNDQKG